MTTIEELVQEMAIRERRREERLGYHFFGSAERAWLMCKTFPGRYEMQRHPEGVLVFYDKWTKRSMMDDEPVRLKVVG